MDKPLRLEIESAAYADFLSLWRQGKFQSQRLGQAFYNHFRLHQLSDQTHLHGLYEADGEKALKLISSVFQIK
ncbi:hypothetical protein CQ009_23745 [Pseudomonas sp. MYb2]|jgi:hypothetical protein|uniref:Uncharacterized protein n=1 Tax=Pseudomonas fluorescens TaxID=294 RepID=A0A5E7MKM6_PSEFL|nr:MULTISPECIES: hypothetical protein [Pseudomonas]KPG96517.1 hypothetical protein AK821_14500 [Pseudomonas sp. RIT-PI-r]MCP1487878.1 hypothetical protein [Pseudomonas fluorescens]PRB44594.1 hypothetical protein CQ025_24525 [Pseudomonas sp. MYb3]PRC30173.1 hypothetical protein CQ009_23745 [Pseudomonas sp. MYb2]VVP25081.1 hypothetical protein PS896_04050 [Pseudomonas fluorescens]